MHLSRSVPAGALALLIVAPAVAAEPKYLPADYSCGAVYGVMHSQRAAMIKWRPQLGGVQFATIDWAARKATLAKTANKDLLDVFELNFTSILTKDIRDGKLTGSADVLALSLDCDKAFGFTPSFMAR